MALVVKFVISGLLVVLIAEIGKRSTLIGALTASLPLTSIIALVWLFRDTRDVERVATMTTEILWLVLPSLALFLVLPPLLRRGVNFGLALAIGCAATAVCYVVTIAVLGAVRARTG